MPPMDANRETDTSDVSEIDDLPPVTETQNPADSSAATGETESSLLSVVRDVVQPKTEEAASPAEGEEAPENTGEAPKDEAEDFSDVPFNQHPRWKQILTQRNTARAEAAAHKEDAVRYQNVQTFLDSHGLTGDEAADGLMAFALAKTNPAEALKLARPWMEKLLHAAGEILPDDLKQMVAENRLDKAAALEISRSRAGLNSLKSAQQFQQQRAEQMRAQEAVTAVSSAATTWENERRAKDPNFGAKMLPLQKEIVFLQRSEGVPKTPEAVRAQLDKAYKAVNAALPAKAVPTTTVPTARPTPRPAASGAVAGDARVKPNGIMGIINDTLNRRGAASV